MKTTRLTSEHLLFVLALLLGLSLRLINLGQAPLSDIEAGWALQALSIVRGENIAIGSQSGYVLLSSLLFWLFNSSNFFARLLPALAGSALVLTPFFFRSRLGRSAALILAFGLALDPGLVAISRQAGSPILAAACVVFAVGFTCHRHPKLAGFFTGLALLSGVALWMGLLGIGLTLIIIRWRKSPEESSTFENSTKNSQTFNWRPFLQPALVSLLITLFLVGSLFFFYPQGLGAWLLSIPEFFKGWVTPSGIPALRLPASLLIYQPLALIFGLICIGHLLWKTQTHLEPSLVKGVTLWFVLSLLVAFIDRGRSMGDLVWTLLPLWTLASLELAYLFRTEENPLISIGQAALTFTLLCIAWLTFSALARAGDIFIDWGLLAQFIAALSLLVIAAYLISLGWTWKVTRPGLAWGSVSFLSYICSRLPGEFLNIQRAASSLSVRSCGILHPSPVMPTYLFQRWKTSLFGTPPTEIRLTFTWLWTHRPCIG
jgi:hypothetical protein